MRWVPQGSIFSTLQSLVSLLRSTSTSYPFSKALAVSLRNPSIRVLQNLNAIGARAELRYLIAYQTRISQSLINHKMPFRSLLFGMLPSIRQPFDLASEPALFALLFRWLGRKDQEIALRSQ